MFLKTHNPPCRTQLIFLADVQNRGNKQSLYVGCKSQELLLLYWNVPIVLNEAISWPAIPEYWWAVMESFTIDLVWSKLTYCPAPCNSITVPRYASRIIKRYLDTITLNRSFLHLLTSISNPISEWREFFWFHCILSQAENFLNLCRRSLSSQIWRVYDASNRLDAPLIYIVTLRKVDWDQ